MGLEQMMIIRETMLNELNKTENEFIKDTLKVSITNIDGYIEMIENGFPKSMVDKEFFNSLLKGYISILKG